VNNQYNYFVLPTYELPISLCEEQLRETSSHWFFFFFSQRYRNLCSEHTTEHGKNGVSIQNTNNKIAITSFAMNSELRGILFSSMTRIIKYKEKKYFSPQIFIKDGSTY
jgi:hypothetical protein